MHTSEGGRYKSKSRVGAHPLQTSQRVGHPGKRGHPSFVRASTEGGRYEDFQEKG